MAEAISAPPPTTTPTAHPAASTTPSPETRAPLNGNSSHASPSASPTHGKKRSRSPSAPPPTTHPIDDPSSPPSPNHPRKRSRAAIDEKTRTRRLFGGLLGGPTPRSRIAQDRKTSLTSNAPSEETLARRASIEARKRSELAKRDEEMAGVQAEKLAELNRRRRKRQLLLEERDKEREWEGKISRVGFLRTKGPGGVYWRPWKLTEEQKEEIEEKRRRAEEHVDEERELWWEEKRRRDKEAERKDETADDLEKDGVEVMSKHGDMDLAQKDPEHDATEDTDKATSPPSKQRNGSPSEDEADNGVDAGEDTVMIPKRWTHQTIEDRKSTFFVLGINLTARIHLRQ
ncbi:hypothetical protein BDZ85DRAFT_317913 [Elsinoe ampelina]|uniref:Pinin/SDK/MemA protein domain-containing protein n=1 Tax=Elsinoe ampelina TaxID=302913 RepID=A0A6A6GIQ1_9PEZI|nr:hypothetical protein BDZ85DRAFT_317913 [Elsinoe ampelina]